MSEKSLVARWNEVALEAVRLGDAKPTEITRALHIAHSSLYDAWAAYDDAAAGAYWDAEAWGPRGELAQATAISTAMHAALSKVFPDHRFMFDSLLAALEVEAGGATIPKEACEVGLAAARAVLAARAEDGSNAEDGYRDTSGYDPVNPDDADPLVDPNHWTPLRVPNGTVRDADGIPIATDNPATYDLQKPLSPHWGGVTPFAIEDGDVYRPGAPPKLGDFSEYVDQLGNVTTRDAAYRDQFGEVLEISASLTDEQKAIAEYWADGPRSSTPPGHWNEIAQDISLRDGHGVGEDAKLFFALNAALFDTGIAVWDAKYAHDLVRPQTAIRHLYEGQAVTAWIGPDKGIGTIRGETWQPYQDVTFVTPPFPEYVSGHSGFSYAAATILAEFTGTDRLHDGVSRGVQDLDGDGQRDLIGRYVAETLDFESYDGDPIVLSWDTVWEAAAEAGRSRLYGGIHIQDGDLAARAMGAEVGGAVWAAVSALFQRDAGGELRPEGGGRLDLGAGEDVLAGGLGALDGLRVERFGADDAIRIEGLSLGDGGLAVRRGSAILEVDADGDGRPDGTIVLDGDFDGQGFRAMTRNGETVLTLVNGADVALTGADEQFRTADPSANVLAAGAGNDAVSAGPGNDVLDGDGGDDRLAGENGADTLIGGAGSDTLEGGAGRDVFAISAADGAGTDVIADYAAGRDRIELAGFGRLRGSDISVGLDAEGDLQVTLPGGQVIVLRGLSSLSQVSLGDVDLVAEGRNVSFSDLAPHRLTEADDLFSVTGRGAQDLAGGGGNDRLAAGGGDDTLTGGRGADTLLGGAGADLIRVTAADLTGPGATDVIGGFTSGEDKVQFIGIPGVAGLRDLAARLTEVDGNVALDFGGGHRLVFDGITRVSQLNPRDAILGGDAPEITVALTDDTGDSAGDRITTGTGIAGTVSDDVGVSALEVRVDGGPWLDISGVVGPDGSFRIPEGLVARRLGEGTYDAEFRVTDAEGKATVAGLDFTLDTTGPKIVSGLDVTLDDAAETLRLTLSEPLSATGPVPADFSLTGPDGPVRITSVDRAGADEIVLTLAGPLDNGTFTLDGTVTDVAGNGSEIGGDVTVDAVTRVVAIHPSDGARSANLDRKITVAFNRPVDAATLDAASVRITALGEALEGRYDLSSDGKLLTFFPEALLPGATQVRIALDGDAIRDADGGPVQVPAPASFSTVSLTRVPGTNVEGFIFDANYRDEDGLDIPLEGVVVSVIGLPGVTATTDETGRFLLEDLPIPLAYLDFDASGVTNRPNFDYGTIAKPVDTVAGRTVGLTSGEKAFNIYFAALAEGDVTRLTPGEATEAGIGENGLANLTEIFPGIDPAQWEKLKVTIPADSLTRDDGTPVDEVQVMAFEPDRIPAPLPPGFDPPVVFTVKAGDATNVDGKAQIAFPNIDDLPLGAKRPILSFDHDAGVWTQTGTAIVVDDGEGGTVLVSEGDSGVNTLGWKFLGIDLSKLFNLDFSTPQGEAPPEDPSVPPDEKPLFDPLEGFESLSPQELANNIASVEIRKRIAEKEEGLLAKLGDIPLLGLIFNKANKDQILVMETAADGLEDSELSVTEILKNYSEYLLGLGFDAIDDLPVSETLQRATELTETMRDTAEKLRSNSDTIDQSFKDNEAFEEFTRKLASDVARQLENGNVDPTTIQLAIEREISRLRVARDQFEAKKNQVSEFGFNDDLALDEAAAQVLEERAKANQKVIEYLESLLPEDPPLQPAPSPSPLLRTGTEREAVTIDLRSEAVLAMEEALGGYRQFADRFGSDLNLVAALERSAAADDIVYSALAQTYRNSSVRADDVAVLVTDLESGLQTRYDAGGGSISIPTAIGRTLEISAYSHSLGTYGSQIINSTDTDDLAPFILGSVAIRDLDRDGLPDVAEDVFGTLADNPDTDDDGILDGAEIAQGLDPLEDLGFPTGIVGALTLSGEALDVALSGAIDGSGTQTAYVATGSHGLAIVDATRFQTPILQAEIDLGGTAEEVAVDPARGLAYVAAAEAGLHVVDVTDPLAPRLDRTVREVGAVSDVTLLGDAVLVAGAEGLAALAARSGDLLVEADLDGRIGSVATEGTTIYAVVNNDTLVSLAFDGTAFTQLDSISIPTPPTRRQPFEDLQVFVDDGVAYVANGIATDRIASSRPLERGGLITFDVADPSAIALISDIDTGDFAAGNLRTVPNGSGLAAVAAGAFGLQILDVRDPEETFDVVTRFDTPGSAESVTIAGGIAFVADGAAGLQVVNFVGFDTAGRAPSVSFDLAATDADPDRAGVQVVEGSLAPLSVLVGDDVQVRNVELLVDGEVVRNDLSAPFDFVFSAPLLASGDDSVDVRVRATDTGGNRTLSDPVTLEIVPDFTPPEIVSTGLAANDILLSGRRAISVTMSEPIAADTVDGTALTVRLEDGGTLASDDVVLLDDGRILQFILDTLPVGDHVLALDLGDATDLAGNAVGNADTTIPIFVVDEPTLRLSGSRIEESPSTSDRNAVQFTLEVVPAPEATAAPVTVSYRILSGTASVSSSFTGDPDVYGPLSGTVTFAAGETSRTVSLATSGDGIDEVDKAVVLEAFSVTGGAFAGGAPLVRATSWVLDNDGAANGPALFVSRPVLREGDAGERLAVFELSLSRPAPEGFVLSYETVDGSATAGEDYRAVSGSVSFVAGQQTASVAVAVLGDTDIEASETFTLSLQEAGTTDVLDAVSLGEATILDDDAGAEAGEPSLTVQGATNEESRSTSDRNPVSWTLTLDEATAAPVTVSYRILSGTASVSSSFTGDPDVYGPLSGTVTFAAGETSRTVSLATSGDGIDEVDKAVVLEAFSVTGGAFAGGAPLVRATSWVLDNDGAANGPALFVSRPVLREGDAGERLAVFELSLSRPAPEGFVLSYETVDGSATAGEDYRAVSGSVSFVAGQQTASVAVAVLGDTDIEASETFTLSLQEAGTTDVLDAVSLGEATILDDDAGAEAGEPSLTVQGATNEESRSTSDRNPVSWTLTLDEATAAPVTVSYRILSGTASVSSSFTGDPDVYGPLSGTVTFAAGETSRTVSLATSGDGIDEVDKAVVLEAFSVTGGAFAGGAPLVRATSWVLDNDGAANGPALFVSRPVLREGDAGERLAVFELSLSRPAPEGFVLSYETVDGSATAGEDYRAVSGSVSFVAGQQTASVAVAVLGDTDIEASETFTLSLQEAGTTDVLDAVSLGEATILDDDAGAEAGEPSLTVQGATNEESRSTSDRNPVSWTLTLDEATAAPVTVSYRILSGTASVSSSFTGDPDVYGPLSGTVTFAAGETSRTVSLATSGDGIDEVDKAVVLEAFSVTGGAFAGGAPLVRATSWVLDNDGAANGPALFVSRPVLREGDAGERLAVFELSLSRPAPEGFVLSYETVDGSATAGEDYRAVSGSVSFVAGQQTASVAVAVLGDTDIEASETFTLSLQEAGTTDVLDAVSLGEATILDDDAGAEAGEPSLTVQGATNEESRSTSDRNPVSWTLTLDEATAAPVTVSYRILSGTASVSSSFTGDPDVYGPLSGTVTFAAGETSRTVSLATSGDGIDEVDKAVVLEAFSVTGGAFAGGAPLVRATSWVLDNDGAANGPALFVSRPVLREGDAGERLAVFELSLSRPAPEGFVLSYETVDGSATAGEDYRAVSGSVSFVAGQQTASVAVAVLGDTDIEASETFTLSLQEAGTTDVLDAVSLGEATILDDDAGAEAGEPSLTVQGATNEESRSTSDRNPVSWTLTLDEATAAPVTVSYRILSGTASVSSSFTGDPDVYGPLSGTVTFAAGETSRTVSLATSGDGIDEVDKAVVLEAFSVTGGAFAGGAPLVRATSWVLDNDGAANGPALFVSRPVLREGDAGERLAVFELSLSRPAPEGFVLSYETVDGSATAGEDYRAVSGSVSFVAGQQTASVAVAVLGDTDIEASETFTLSLQEAGTTDVLDAVSLGEATILDDDAGAEAGEPSLTVQGATNEESRSTSDRNPVSWTLTLDEATAAPVTVSYRILSGTASVSSSFTGDPDVYGPLSGTVTFAAGETSRTVSLATSGDGIDEVDKAVVLEAFSVTGGAFAGGAPLVRATSWVLDNDGAANGPALFVSRPVLREGDAGERLAVFELSLSRPAPEGFVLSYETVDGSATAGEDYRAVSGSVSFVAGQQTASVAVAVLGDTDIEASETFTLSLQEAGTTDVLDAVSLGEATILDDDAGAEAFIFSTKTFSGYMEDQAFQEASLIQSSGAQMATAVLDAAIEEDPFREPYTAAYMVDSILG